MDVAELNRQAALAAQAGLPSLWRQYKEWLGDTFPLVAAALTPPAEEQAETWAELEGLLGAPAPEELLELYRLTGGESQAQDEEDVGYGVFFGVVLLSPTQVVAEASRRQALFEAEDGWICDPDAPARHLVPGAIRPVDDHRHWVPFARSGTARVAVDLAPGPEGRVGQIINVGRDEDARFVLAPSLAEWLGLLLTLGRNGYAGPGTEFTEPEGEDWSLDEVPDEASLCFEPTTGVCLIDQLRAWKEAHTGARDDSGA